MCKCPEGFFVLGDDTYCRNFPRDFYPQRMAGLGCACVMCSDLMAKSKIRNTAHKQDSEKCKCPKGQIVSGNNSACSSLEPSRYFDPRMLMPLIRKGMLMPLIRQG